LSVGTEITDSTRLPRRSLLLVAAGHLILEVCNNGLPVVYPLLVGAGWLTYTQIGVVTFVASLSAALSQPVLGYASDRWDPRRMVVGAVALSALSMGATGFSSNFVALALLVALAMVGSAAFHPAGASLSAASSWEGRKGAAVAIFSVGGNVGSALSPWWLSLGVGRFGFRGTAIIAPLGLLGALLIWSQLRSTPLPRSHRASGGDQVARRGSVAGLVVIVLAVFFRTWFQISVNTYLPSWAEAGGRSIQAGGGMLSAALVAMALGSLLGGTLSDRTGRWPLMAVSLGLLAPLVWSVPAVPAPLQPVLIALLGFLVGATFPVAIVAAQETWPTGHGMASGLTMGLTWIGGGIGAVVTGAVADRFSLDVALQWLWLPAVLATVCILAYPVLTRGARLGEVLGRPDETSTGD
jgi:FSR family fosmidomycin resistance protein-like MFS transporter